MARPRRSPARAFLEALVVDQSVPMPERMRAAIALLANEREAAKAQQRPSAIGLPLTWEQAKAAEAES